MQTISVLTLVDITETSVVRHTSELEYKRNQQRNWEAVLQTIGIRAQPMRIKGPSQLELNLDALQFGESYHGVHKVWGFEFSVEHDDVFRSGDDPLYFLETDFNQVPIITGLDETARFLLPIFYTHGAIKNIYFFLHK